MSFLRNLLGGLGKPKTEIFAPPAPPSAESVAQAEKALGIKFPASFVSFMNDARPMQLPPCAQFYWIGEGIEHTGDIIAANQREREESSSPLPPFLVGFYNDGMGNQVCFDTRRCLEGGEYPIVYWDHELGADDNLAASMRGSPRHDSAGVIAMSFPGWLKLVHEENT